MSNANSSAAVVKKVINLLPPAYGQARRAYRELVAAGVVVMLIMAAVTVVHVFRAAQAEAYRRAAGQLTFSREAYAAAQKDLATLHAREKTVQKTLDLVASWRQKGAMETIEAIDAVGSALPVGAWLTALRKDDAGRLAMTGRAVGWDVVARLLANLRRDQRFGSNPILTSGEGTEGEGAGGGAAGRAAAGGIGGGSVGFSITADYRGQTGTSGAATDGAR